MNNLAFLVACSTYDFPDEWPNLPDTISDIIRIEKVLTDNCGCLKENIVLCSEEAHHQYAPKYTSIFSMIKREMEIRVDIFDIVFFYFSGHGLIKDGEVNIVPIDASQDRFILPINQIIKDIDATGKATQIVLIIDCCQTEAQEKSAHKLPQFEGHVIFYSCAPYGVSYLIPKSATDKFGAGSVYTYCMASALSKDSKCQTVGEVAEYVSEMMASVCRQFSYNQIPHTTLQDASLSKLTLTNNHWVKTLGPYVGANKQIEESTSLTDSSKHLYHLSTDSLQIVYPTELSISDFSDMHNIDLAVMRNDLVASLDTIYGWHTYNHFTHIGLRDVETKRIVGYFGLLPIREETYKRILSGDFLDTEFSEKDLELYDFPHEYKGYVSGVAIAPQYQNTDALIRLYNAFIDFLIELADNREIYLSDIITEAISENGERFCKLVGMEKVSTSVHNTKGVYHISMLPPRFTRKTKKSMRLYTLYSNRFNRGY